MLNGVVIGVIPASGDDAKDALAGQALLIEKGLYKDHSRAERAFGQAAAFTASAGLLYEKFNAQRDEISKYAVPFVVIMAFSVELYLKALAQIHGKKLRGHDLADLYTGLPDDAKAALEAIAPEAQQRFQTPVGLKFQDVFAKTRSSFVEWRYNYESDAPSSIFPIDEIFFVGFSLHAACVRSGKVGTSKP